MENRILLIGYNFSPEPTGIGKYSGEMIHWLANKGYDCTVLTTYPYYPYWKVQEPYYEKRFWYLKEIQKFSSGGKITIYRCPMYVPVNPTGMKRMLLDVSFLGTAFLQLLKLLFHRKYDTIITVVPSFQFGLLGCFYKLIRGAKSVYHIQDMQIEAAEDLNMMRSKTMIKLLYKVEDFIFRNTDIISTISEKMVLKISEKARKDVLLFPNWSDTDFFAPLHNRTNLKSTFGLLPTDQVVLYSGAIGEKQGLEAIVYAAATFKEMSHVKFVICGTGPYKIKLEKLVQSLSLNNILFFPLQPMENFNRFLNMADIHLVIQKSKASDLVMPSKLTTILAVGGLALITANEDSGLHALVRKYDMGILVDAENQEALNYGIKHALNEAHSNKKQNARKYAESYLDINTIMTNFLEQVFKFKKYY